MTRTMLVGADRALLNETADFLREAGSQALVVADVARAEREISRFRPEMIVVSLDDAEANGWKFMFRHGFNGGAKVIATTANGDASQELTVLRLGAQDYIRLPVPAEVLSARITSRAGPNGDARACATEQTLKVEGKRGTLVLDKGRFQAFWLDSELVLTKTEFDLLFALARHDGLVKSREQLIETIYDHSQQCAVNDRNIDSHVKRVRNKFRKIDPLFDGIETVYGIGYKLKIDRTCRVKPAPLPVHRLRSAGASHDKARTRVVSMTHAALQTAGM